MSDPHLNEDAQPRDLQFTHFGVLQTPPRSKASIVTSVSINILLAVLFIILGAAARKTVIERHEAAMLVVPLKEKPPEPPKPPPVKIIPPKPIPRPVEPPKIKLPDVKIPDPPKVQAVNIPKPLPVVTPAPPKAVVAAAAPKPVNVNLGQSASVVNHDTHPSAVALGRQDNPIAPSNLPATASVNLGQRGLAGMPSTNTGGGPPSTRVTLGSGQPNGSIGGTGARAVQGVALGVKNGTPGGTGNGIGTRPQQVALGVAPPAPTTQAVQATKAPVRQGPQVLFKPKPVYTAEATALHLEGVVSVRIRVSASGSVSVVGVTSGLGHGLDEAAVRACQGTRFKPAVDSNGNPIDWEGVVNITFQTAG